MAMILQEEIKTFTKEELIKILKKWIINKIDPKYYNKLSLTDKFVVHNIKEELLKMNECESTFYAFIEYIDDLYGRDLSEDMYEYFADVIARSFILNSSKIAMTLCTPGIKIVKICTDDNKVMTVVNYIKTMTDASKKVLLENPYKFVEECGMIYTIEDIDPDDPLKFYKMLNDLISVDVSGDMLISRSRYGDVINALMADIIFDMKYYRFDENFDPEYDAAFIAFCDPHIYETHMSEFANISKDLKTAWNEIRDEGGWRTSGCKIFKFAMRILLECPEIAHKRGL